MCDKPRTLFQQVIAVLGGMFGLYWDNGKENGNYHDIIGYITGHIGVILRESQKSPKLEI